MHLVNEKLLRKLRQVEDRILRNNHVVNIANNFLSVLDVVAARERCVTELKNLRERNRDLDWRETRQVWCPEFKNILDFQRWKRNLKVSINNLSKLQAVTTDNRDLLVICPNENEWIGGIAH